MLLWTVFALLKLSMQSRLFFPQNHCDTCILSIASDTARLPAIMIATAMIKNKMPVGSNLNIFTRGFVRIVNIGENNNMDNVF